MAEFGDDIAAALRRDVDEVLVVGHSSGAHLGVSILADLIRAGRVPEARPGAVVPVAGAGGADGVVPARRAPVARRSALSERTR